MGKHKYHIVWPPMSDNYQPSRSEQELGAVFSSSVVVNAQITSMNLKLSVIWVL